MSSVKRKRGPDTLRIVTRKCVFDAWFRVDQYIPANLGQVVYMCDACLTLHATEAALVKHSSNCQHTFWLPGDEVYRDSQMGFVVMEMDGRKPACIPLAQRMGVLSKMFLCHKTTVDDTHFFGYYGVFEVDDYGYRFVGYFSREWGSGEPCDNNLSCITVLPPYQSKGYGRLMIDMSYEMSRRERHPGTPERPFTTAGRRVFQRYWNTVIFDAIISLARKGSPITVSALSSQTGMVIDDILLTLRRLDVMRCVSSSGDPLIVVSPAHFKRYEKKMIGRSTAEFVNHYLQWTPQRVT